MFWDSRTESQLFTIERIIQDMELSRCCVENTIETGYALVPTYYFRVQGQQKIESNLSYRKVVSGHGNTV
jgi:hypothetical protein